MKLAVVGSRSLDRDPNAEHLIGALLDQYLAHDPELTVISGGPGGIDRMAAEAARRRGLPVVEHLPQGPDRRHLFASKEAMARDCDELVRIASGVRRGGPSAAASTSSGSQQ